MSNELNERNEEAYNIIRIRFQKLILEDPELNPMYAALTPSSQLNEKQRGLISRRVIANELFITPTKKISSQTLEYLADVICEFFPNETKGTYFVKSAGKEGSKSSYLGKLWFGYHNKRNRSGIATTAPLIKRRRSSKANDQGVENVDITSGAETQPDQTSDKLLWLKTGTEPWETVLEYWESTFQSRQEKFKDPSYRIDQYYQDFLALKYDSAKVLLTADFERLYPGKVELLSQKFAPIKDKLLTAWTATKDVFKNVEDNALLLVAPTLIEEKQVLPIFHLWASVIRPKFIKVLNSKTGKVMRKKPTNEEVRESLYMLVENATDINSKIEERRQKLAGQPLQPIPLFVGPSIVDVESSYVIINDNTYVCPNPLYAFRLAFISFFVLHAQYPDAAQQFWLAVQRIFFGISCKDDEPTTSLITYLNQFKDE